MVYLISTYRNNNTTQRQHGLYSQTAMDNRKPTILPGERTGDLYDDTVDQRSQEQVDERNADYNPGVPGTATAATQGLLQRKSVAATTEIGDPQGRIPSEQSVRDQLEAARRSSLPIGASSSFQPQSGLVDTPAPTPQEAGIGNSSDAPGYEKADDAVPQKSYHDGAGHAPFELPHERLVSRTGT